MESVYSEVRTGALNKADVKCNGMKEHGLDGESGGVL
jgi:hypothetical protein